MRNVRAGLGLFVVVVALFVTVASGESNEAKKVEEGAASTKETAGSEASAKTEVFVVGDKVELGDWQLVVHEVTDPVSSTNEYSKPAEGQRWVGVDAEVFNQSQKAQTVSSLICFDLLDDTNRSHSIAFAPGVDKAPDGEVASGSSRRGTIVFEVPADATGLRLQFKCDFLSSGSATVNL